MKKLLPYFCGLILILAATLLILPFSRPGFFATDDGEWAIVRLAEMVRELKDLQIPPRWSDYLNHGYGYPLFSFTYPLPFYLGSLIRLTGADFTEIIKLLFVLSVFMSGYFMFLLAAKIKGNWAGMMAAFFYMTVPYRLTDLYVRGSLGESLALSLFPLIFYLTLVYREKTGLKRGVLLSLSLASLLLTHNVLSLLFSPFWFLWLITVFKDVKSVLPNKLKLILFPVILSFALAAFFIVPALHERKYILLSIMPLADKSSHFLSLGEIFMATPRVGLPSFGLTAQQTSVLILSVILLIKNRAKIQSAVFFLLSVPLTVFLLHSSSRLVWQLPLLSSIDFPWRMGGILCFIVALASVFLFYKKQAVYAGSLLILIGFMSILPLTGINNPINKSDDYYLTNDATTTSADELMPVYVSRKPENRYLRKAEIVTGDAEISDLNYNSRKAKFTIQAVTPGTVRLNTMFFPGWQLADNGKPMTFRYNNDFGIIEADFGHGRHQIEANFTETPVRFAADIVSLSALFYCVYIFIRKKHDDSIN